MSTYAHDNIVPDEQSSLSKKEQVADMFDDIAHRYDFLNRFLSAGIDVGWRKKALKMLKEDNPKHILDVATGTADVAIMATKILQPTEIIGIDISQGMLSLGNEKVEKAGLGDTIKLQIGDSETINFANDTFDAVTVAFGVRNFQNLEKGLSEIYRVLKPGGRLIVLEFSKPKYAVARFGYNLYMKYVAANVGKMVSKSNSAYQYLDESITNFPEGKDFLNVLKKVQFVNTKARPLTLGVCNIYSAQK